MRFGCCTNMLAGDDDKTGMAFIEKIAEYGYDYVELPLAQICEAEKAVLSQIRRRLDDSGIPCEVCNNFFPQQIRLTGPDTDPHAIRDYYKKAIDTAAELGAAIIVFGSGDSKRVPAGFSHEEAFRQLVEVTSDIGEYARQYPVLIVIEPVRRPDTNIINTFADGVELAKAVGHSNVKVLADIYHMACEEESPEVLKTYGKSFLRHVHFSRPLIPVVNGVPSPESIRHLFERELNRRGCWRTYPADISEWDYSPFIRAIRSIGYDDRISLEAPVTDFDRQAKEASVFLHRYFS